MVGAAETTNTRYARVINYRPRCDLYSKVHMQHPKTTDASNLFCEKFTG